MIFALLILIDLVFGAWGMAYFSRNDQLLKFDPTLQNKRTLNAVLMSGLFGLVVGGVRHLPDFFPGLDREAIAATIIILLFLLFIWLFRLMMRKPIS